MLRKALKLLWILILFALAAGSVGAIFAANLSIVSTARAEAQILYVTTGTLNVRAAPDIKSACVGELSRGRELQIDSWYVDNGWLCIPYANAPEGWGWVSIRYLSQTPPVSAKRAPEGRIAANGKVNLRDGPAGDYLFSVRPGVRVKVLASMPDGNDAWYKVTVLSGRASGKTGWAVEQYVRFAGEPDQETIE